MYKIKLGAVEYNLIQDSTFDAGVGFGGTLTAIIYAEDHTLPEIEAVLSNPDNLASIEIINAETEEVVQIITGFSKLISIDKKYDYITETIVEPKYHKRSYVRNAVISFTISKPTVEDALDDNIAATEKNGADIEYIAIMSDIELE